MVALPQLKLILLKPYKAQKKSNIMARILRIMSPKLSIIIFIRRATTLEIAQSQKTSCSLYDFYIGNY